MTREHAEYVNALQEAYKFVSMKDNEELFIYRESEGIYVPGEAFVKAWVEAQYQGDDDSAKRDMVAEVIAAIKRRSYVEREVFNPTGKICLANGVLDTATLEVTPHSNDFYFTARIPVAYESTAACPQFETFLEEILPDRDAQLAVQMLFGYTLAPGNPYQTAFMFVGGGNNGKTTLLLALRALLGPENVSTETLQDLASSRFSASSLWSKYANVAADIPHSAVRYTGTFKMAVGGDPLRGEKKFKDTFSFINPAKLIFSANELPAVDDKSYAFWRRWYIVAFDQDFSGREDRDLSAKLQLELPGILAWSLRGLKMLRERGAFPRALGAKDIKERWKRESDPLYWFISECVEKDAASWVSKDVFYETYAAFVEDHNLRQKSREQVGRELRTLLPSVREERHREGKVFVRGWSGVKLREPQANAEAIPEVKVLESYQGAVHDDAPANGNKVLGPITAYQPCDTCGQRAAWKVAAGIWMKAACEPCLPKYGLTPPVETTRHA